jgi:alkylation response protein AidB-like acyl-CoA dehydrogenase
VPIGSFQAVQHRLADVFVQAEAARAITRTAWLGRTPELATAALAAAQRAVRSATEHCQQVLGAMGCTWEHPLHRYIRRGIALAALLDPDEDLRALAHTSVLATNPVEVLA